MEWKDQYKHPLWQKKRLEALDSAGYECENCGCNDKQLNVHHVAYKKNANIWDYNITELSVLCECCHRDAHLCKDSINDYFLAVGAGSERTVAELVSGFYMHDNLNANCIGSHMQAVGYGAGYIRNLDYEVIVQMTKISPDVLAKFVKENS